MTEYRHRLWLVSLAAAVLLGALLAAVMTGADVVTRFDRAGHTALREVALAHPDWLSTMRVLTHLGDTITIVLVDAGVAVACLARGRRRTALFVAVSAVAVWGARILVRDLVHRPRPDDAFWSAEGASFPSGHTTNSAAMVALAVIAAWPWLGTTLARTTAIVGAVALAATVGLSRVAGGVHWPTDVIGGWLLAATLVPLLAVLIDPDRRRRAAPPEG